MSNAYEIKWSNVSEGNSKLITKKLRTLRSDR